MYTNRMTRELFVNRTNARHNVTINFTAMFLLNWPN